MKTRKNILFLILGISVIAIALIVFLILRNKPDIGNGTDAVSLQKNQTAANDGITTITYAIPDFCVINLNNVKFLNEELQKNGHDYQLELKYLPYDTYSQDVVSELENGTVDVAFLGLSDGDNCVYSLINSGLVINLDEALSSGKGKVVYDEIPGALWESVKCNGHIYSIPQTLAQDQAIYAVFNKDYVRQEAIDNWDGSLDGIYKIIKDVKWNDEETPRFQYLLSDFGFESMIGCEIRYGLVYDYDTMKIEKPLESEKFMHYISTLEKMKKEGFIGESVSYFQNAAYADEDAKLRAGKFVAVLTSEYADNMYIKDNLCIKEIAPVLSSRINGSIGISSKTGKADAALDLLGILYGEGNYGNILLYGRQDVDYKLVDGYVVNTDGSEYRYDFLNKLALNLFMNVYPVEGEIFPENRKEKYFDFYSKIKLSPFIGFEADTAGNKTIPLDVEDFLASLNTFTLEESVAAFAKKYQTDGIDEYYASVKKQWETFKQ